ncbi:MAG TPA: metalloregulator ArsR/SmtB family transcription factor [Acidimicrobiia bacterium]|nr:metalloregulator ArsR/SmtB family transcription factor [Acidimicrobiia bacterium]
MTALVADTFGALADPTRLAILERLGAGTASVSQLAAPHDMSLRGVLKHIAVLEDAGLVRTTKRGRVRECELDRRRIDQAAAFIERLQTRWESRLDRLENYLETKKS